MVGFASAVKKLAILIFLALSLLTAATQEKHWCATGPETDRKLEELERWVQARERLGLLPARRPAKAAARFQDGVYLLEADSATAPFDRPFNLENSSLLFTRKDNDTFTVSKSALVYDADPGPLFYSFQRSGQPDWNVKTYQLANFTFPFSDGTYSQLYLSAHRGVYLSPPPAKGPQQYGAFEIAGWQIPLIAPLLQTPDTTAWSPFLYLKEGSDSLTLTWRSKTSPSAQPLRDLDIQVVLYKNGNILFSYKLVKNTPWGAVVVTSGKEAWRNSKTGLLSASDLTGDVGGQAEDAWRDMLDIESVSVNRVGQSDLLEFQIKVKGQIDRAAVPPEGINYAILLRDGGNIARISLSLGQQSDSYSVPGWGASNSPAVRADGQTLVFSVLEGLLALKSASLTLDASAAVTGKASDSLRATLTLDSGRVQAETDLATLAAPVDMARPVFEVFTLPILNPSQVWERLKAAYGLREDQVDGLAIYQNFYTDIILYAGAYSTVGNAGADGIGRGSSRAPKSPALLHMNRVSSGMDYGFLMNHEFGHRWLYFIRIMEDGSRSSVLNPASGHPAQYVHTPAAFQLRTATDYSVMGGSWFTDNGNGAFTTPSQNGAYSYSWHELYLMGLASTAEASQPWFYVANSNPPLGLAYNPPLGRIYSGTRKDVTLQQVLDAMGPRIPSVETSPKTFTVLFVLMDHADSPATSEEISQIMARRSDFARYFAVATGNRASMITRLDGEAVTGPRITAPGVVNAASFLSRAVAPGEIISVFGTGIGPAGGVGGSFNARGLLDISLANTRVLFDGVPAPLVYVQANQVSAVVPYSMAGRFTTELQTEHAGARTNTVTLPVAGASPGIFTRDSSGKGQGAILNQDGSFNSATNPAEKGSVVMIYATGEGQTDPAGLDGKPAADPLPKPRLPVSVTIGGLPAEVQYAGGAPGLIAGVIQVNARVPADAPSGNAVPVVLAIGNYISQPGVTLAVK